jgi:hypothetical protein
MDKVEFLILRNLLYNEEYIRKVIPFLKPEYFEDENQKIVFQEILSFVEQYNQPATKEVLSIEIEKRKDINEQSFKDIVHLISCLEDVPVELNWLISTTEKWCRDRAIYLALMESIYIADGKDEKKNRDAIPSILSDALAVSFDNHIGHDYLQDYEQLNLILNILTKSPKVVSLTKLLISLLLVRASASLYSCAMSLAPSCSKGGTFSILQWKWQKNALLKELMQIS